MVEVLSRLKLDVATDGRLAAEEGLLVRELDGVLDADCFLDAQFRGLKLD